MISSSFETMRSCSVNSQSHSSSPAGIHVLVQSCPDLVATVGLSLSSRPLMFAGGDVLPPLPRERGMLDSVSKRPPDELAAGREVFGPPRRVEVVQERLRYLQRYRSHVGVLVCPCVGVRHTFVLPLCYQNCCQCVGIHTAPRGAGLQERYHLVQKREQEADTPVTGDNHARKRFKMTRTTQHRVPDLTRFQLRIGTIHARARCRASSSEGQFLCTRLIHDRYKRNLY